MLGLGLGWVYLELGAAVVPLLVVPILIARSTFASYLELKAGQEQTIETLILALEAKDRYTAGHAQRVATFSEYVGAELAFGQRRMERLRYAALMHDIGKLVVPEPAAQQAGPSHRGGVRAGEAPRGRCRSSCCTASTSSLPSPATPPPKRPPPRSTATA